MGDWQAAQQQDELGALRGLRALLRGKPHSTNDRVIAFLDAHRAYIEIHATDTTRGCILHEGGAWRAFRPDDSEIGEPGFNGMEFGYPTLEDAIAAYIDAVSKETP